MLRAACITGPALSCKNLWIAPYSAKNFIQRASLSTNTAIHRGIRRSDSRPGRDRSASRYGNIRETRKSNLRSGNNDSIPRYGVGVKGKNLDVKSESASRYDEARIERRFNPREDRHNSIPQYDESRKPRKSNPREDRPRSRPRYNIHGEERKSNFRESRPEPAFRFNETRNDRGLVPRETIREPVSRYYEDRKQIFTAQLQNSGSDDKFEGARATRPPKPNHQQGLDVEDIRQQANARNDRRTSEQRNYLQGGRRKSDSPWISRLPGSGAHESRRTTDEFRGSPPDSTRYEKVKSFKNSSDEESRRASLDEYSSNIRPDTQRPKPEVSVYDILRRSESKGGDTPLRPRKFTMGRGKESPRSSSNEQKVDDSHDLLKDPGPSIRSFEYGADNNLNIFDNNGSFGEPDRETSKDDRIRNRDSTDSDEPRAFKKIRAKRDNYSSSSDGDGQGRTGDFPYFRRTSTPSGGPAANGDRLFVSSEASYDTLAIPYTTPASEFLYGTSVVSAALKSRRRKLYKLYIYSGENREAHDQDLSLRKMALAAGVQVTQVQGDGLRLMDKMSTGRPHNGYILEASPLQKLPVTGLRQVQEPCAALNVFLDHQSREDEAINGTDTNIRYQTQYSRYPLILFLDGVLDPGNLGAILRTAFFLGVDAVAISTRNSAPLSPVAIKASSGACESVPLLSVSQPENFIDNSRRNGWRFYSSAAPLPHGTAGRRKSRSTVTTSTLGFPTQYYPCVLMLGGEGEGLRRKIQRKADFTVGVEGYRAGQGGVDSLNVSVAAGLLCDAFMKKPPADRLSSALKKSSPEKESAKMSPPPAPVSSSGAEQSLAEDPLLDPELNPSSAELGDAVSDSDAGNGEEDGDGDEDEDDGVQLEEHDLSEESVEVDKHRLF